MRWGWRAYLISLGVAIVAYYALAGHTRTILGDGIGLSAGVAMFAGIRWHRPEPQVAWLLLAFGVLSLAIGDVVFANGQDVPSLADMLYVSAYPVIALGLLGLRSWTGVRHRTPTLATAAVIACVVGAVTWLFLIVPAGKADVVTTPAKIIAVGYPVLDLVLIGLLLRAMRGVAVPTALRLLGVGLVLMLVADIGYAAQNFGDAYVLGSALDAMWFCSYALFGACALHPSVRDDVLVWGGTPVVHHSTIHDPEGSVATQVVTGVIREALGQDLRFGVVVRWTGRMLVGLGLATMSIAAKWVSVQTAVLGGAYSAIGFMLWFAGARLAYT